MRRKRWLAIAVLVVALCGCSREDNDRAAAQAYLEEKYKSEFTCTGQDKNLYGFSQNGQECWVKVEKESYQDNYQSLYYAEAVNHYFEELARENVGTSSMVEVYTGASYLGTQEILDYKHYLQECGEISVVIYTSDSSKYKEEVMRRLCQNLKTAGIGCTIRMYYVDNACLSQLKKGAAFDESQAAVVAAGVAQLERSGECTLSWSR